MDRGAWRAIVYGVARVRHDLVIKPPHTVPDCGVLTNHWPYNLQNFHFREICSSRDWNSLFGTWQIPDPRELSLTSVCSDILPSLLSPKLATMLGKSSVCKSGTPDLSWLVCDSWNVRKVTFLLGSSVASVVTCWDWINQCASNFYSQWILFFWECCRILWCRNGKTGRVEDLEPPSFNPCVATWHLHGRC